MNSVPANARKPARLAFYGDDFTGSTDALEVLAFSGLRCALFLKPPSPEMLERFGGLDAIGLAGDSRGMTPSEMETALPPLLQSLMPLAPVVHYKVCSTFDSAPGIGSIGRVIELARRDRADAVVPIVAGNPALGRYCLFGNLFARSGTDGKTYRIDRHPIMSVHPVTPMEEADLTMHLGRQSALRFATFTLADFGNAREEVDRRLEELLSDKPDALLFDSASAEQLTEVGRLLDGMSHGEQALFVVGSSGVEYALTQWWRKAGLQFGTTEGFDRFGSAGPVLVISASASALTDMQIDAALASGFAEMPLSARTLVDDSRWPEACGEIVSAATKLLERGRSVILHTARGPADARIAEMVEALIASGLNAADARHQGGRTLGVRLGQLTQAVLARHPLRRIVLSGGDTSSQVTQVLAPDALTVVARLAPGAPLCRMHALSGPYDGLEVALKGGQMGDRHFFQRARDGCI